ncbi:MAG: ATP-dependent DNA helicase [Thaumarchaeota archaeon]|nr:ATP-dependent DNA helicase [Nitrososphaerota archaeon]
MSIKLDDKQKKAVQHSGSPLLVIAGPGSGKTRVIIERVMHLIKSGIKPSEILCLTFSEKAAAEMMQRLEERLDITDMQISTFHASAKNMLEDNVLDSGIGMSSGIIKRHARLVWGLENIDNFEFKHIEVGNNAVEVIESVTDGVSAFKAELISSDELYKYIDAKLNENLDEDKKDFVLKLADLHKVYLKYQEFQQSKTVIDFDDMVVFAVDLLKKKPNILSRYQKKYRHILVDEFQDNNFAQLELVKQITSSGNVTVVGDDDQSIYRFQGAYLTNFKDFQKYFSNNTEIILDNNYRSTQSIVGVANHLHRAMPNRHDKVLKTTHEQGEKITVAQCTNESSEVEFVVKTIKELLGKNIQRRDGSSESLTYKDFVVLARKRSDGKKFAKGLKAHGIPTTHLGESNVFSTPVVRDIMAFLSIAENPGESGIAINRLMMSNGISDVNIAKINLKARKKAWSGPAGYDYVLDTIKERHTLDISQKDKLGDIEEQIQRIVNLKSNETVSGVIYEIIMSVSGLYKKSIQTDTPDNIRSQSIMKTLYNIAIEFESLYPQGTLGGFMRHLNLINRFDMELDEGPTPENTVQVTTIHQSKGREFPVVFIADVAKNKLPLRYRAKKFYVPNDLAKGMREAEDERELYRQEERRLFYVAMTRAQNMLYITYASRYGQNKNETKPSIFLDELDFEKNPLINHIKYEEQGTDVILKKDSIIERIKNDRQNMAVDAINQMRLKSAIQDIVELAQIRHYDMHGNLEGFDSSEILKPSTSRISEADLKGVKIPLVDKNEISLSPSKIKSYETCPLQFKFAHIMNVPSKSKPYFDTGNAIHSVAEHMTKLQLEGITPTEELAFKVLEKEWNPIAYQSKLSEEQEKENAKSMVRTYLKWLVENKNTPVAVEKKFSIKIEGVQFKGKIDRIEKTPDGKYVVIDFKTGKTEIKSKDVKTDPQLNIYALGVEEQYEELPETTSLFYLKKDKIVENLIEESQVRSVSEEIGETVKLILDEKFDATPGYMTCKNCDYRSICSEKEES